MLVFNAEVWLIFESETVDDDCELIDVCPLQDWKAYPEKYRAELLESDAAREADRRAQGEQRERERVERERQERLRVKWWQVWRW
jgi:hypothetical protein